MTSIPARPRRILAALAVIVVASPLVRAQGVTRFWAGEEDGAEFAIPENWDPEGVPELEDSAVIEGEDVVVTFSTESDVVGLAVLSVNDGARLEQTGGDLSTSEVRIGEVGAGRASISDGFLRCQNGGGDDFRIGYSAGATGEFDLDGGEVLANDDIIIGHDGAGVLNQTGGVIRGGYTVVANNPGAGPSVWNMSGGLFEGMFGDVEVGDDDVGEVNHSGGTMWVHTSLSIGNRSGTGIYRASGEAVIDCTHGTGDLLIGVGRGGSAGGTGILEIEGPEVTILVAGNLDFDPGGVAAEATLVERITGPEHSEILVRGVAALFGGRLEVELDGYSPADGDSWVLVRAGEDLTGLSELADPFLPLEPEGGTVMGPFADVEFPAVEGIEWELEYAETEVTLIAHVTATGGMHRPSDSNGDGNLDISDGIHLLNALFNNPNGAVLLPCGDGSLDEPANVRLADYNTDGQVNLTDGVLLFQHLFLGGSAPVLGLECAVIEGCDTSSCP